VIILPNGTTKPKPKEPFSFRAKTGDFEIELRGGKKEVLETIKELPNLMTDIHKAFEGTKPSASATLTVKRKKPQQKPTTQRYPLIPKPNSCRDALMNILATDWGKWRPHTIQELYGALDANGIRYSGRKVAGVLLGLVKGGKVKRWKTDAGCVYILAEGEISP
jgi:hypothetical protein